MDSLVEPYAMDLSHLDKASKNLDRLLEYVSSLKQENRRLKRKLDERQQGQIISGEIKKLITERERVKGRLANILKTLDNALAKDSAKS